jgi:tRNA-splicing endonuclease subunit Sen54
VNLLIFLDTHLQGKLTGTLDRSNGDKGSTPAAVPFIPKRGEKDFEPLPASSAFPPSSKEATLSAHQQNTLQTSRNALYSALSSGSRQHSSRHHNSFTWRPELARATCDNGIATYGIHFGAIGHFHVDRKQVELLPEEALYMNERGAIELWKETAEGARVPMSVQQAWAELIGHDELTTERYQVSTPIRS